MRLTVIQRFRLSQFPTKRCLDAAEVTVLVDENADVDITEAREIAAQQSGLFASELKQKGAAAPKEPGRVPQYASEDLGAVRSAVVGERRLECEGVPLQQRQVGRRHIRHHTDDYIDAAFERAGERGKQIPEIGLHTVRPRTGNGSLVDVGGDDPRRRTAAHQGPANRAAPGAEVDRRPTCWQPRDGAPRERLAVPAWDVDARCDADLELAERAPSGDPRQWLPGEASSDQRVEDRVIPGRALEELGGFFLRSDEPRARQDRGKGRGIVAH